jgi:SNF2 family DNA or RNA helicase
MTGTKNANNGLLAPKAGISYLEHQETGIRWMMDREAADAVVCRGGILGDDMGLGKTFQCIGLLKNSPLDLKTLIVCPPALVAGWTEELEACGYFVSTILSGGGWTSDLPASRVADRPIVWLTTYPKMSMYHMPIARAGAAFGRIVLDEGHAIRNGRKTSRWQHAMKVATRATCRWILSATPVQNGLDDWKNLCWWLRTKCRAGDYETLADTIMLRRTMAELRGSIAALPPAARFINHELTIPVGGAEHRLFQTLCNQLESVIDSRSVSALIKLELYLRIQQFLVHPQVYVESMRTKFGRAYPRPDWAGTATKWTAVMTELEKGIAASVGQIVFCNFRQEIDMVCDAATVMGAEVFAIRGGMGVDKVGAAVKNARAAVAEGKPVVIVVQIVSGGVGLNLQFCKRILFLSQHWNPAVVHQAVGRAVRIGQKDRVEVHTFRVIDDVMDNMDRKMVETHSRKIDDARELCASLYEGYEPLDEALEAFDGQEESIVDVVRKAVASIGKDAGAAADEDPLSP